MPLLATADLPGGVRHLAGIIAVPRGVAAEVRALWITVDGATVAVAVER